MLCFSPKKKHACAESMHSRGIWRHLEAQIRTFRKKNAVNGAHFFRRIFHLDRFLGCQLPISLRANWVPGPFLSVFRLQSAVFYGIFGPEDLQSMLFCTSPGARANQNITGITWNACFLVPKACILSAASVFGGQIGSWGLFWYNTAEVSGGVVV